MMDLAEFYSIKDFVELIFENFDFSGKIIPLPYDESDEELPVRKVYEDLVTFVYRKYGLQGLEDLIEMIVRDNGYRIPEPEIRAIIASRFRSADPENDIFARPQDFDVIEDDTLREVFTGVFRVREILNGAAE